MEGWPYERRRGRSDPSKVEYKHRISEEEWREKGLYSKGKIISYALSRIPWRNAPWLFDSRNRGKIETDLVDNLGVDGTLVAVFSMRTPGCISDFKKEYLGEIEYEPPSRPPETEALQVAVEISSLELRLSKTGYSIQEIAMQRVNRLDCPWLFDPENWKKGRIRVCVTDSPLIFSKRVVFQLDRPAPEEMRAPPSYLGPPTWEKAASIPPGLFESDKYYKNPPPSNKPHQHSEDTERLALQEIVRRRKARRSVQI